MLNRSRFFSPLGVVALAASLAACAPVPMQPAGYYPGAYPQQPVYPQGQGAYATFGRVTNVEYLRAGQSPGVAGTVVGGAVGGLAGNQIGRGSGRTAATVVGIVGGALIGHAIEQNMNRGGQDFYRVTVQYDNGGSRTFDYGQAPNVQIGDRVHIEGNQLYR